MADWSGVELKLRRAGCHLADLDDDMKAYLERRPYAVHVEPDGDDLVYCVEVRESPPLSLAGAVGDCIHNARSALDHLAWRLVEDGGGTPGRGTFFPISESEPKFQKALPLALHGASASSVALIEAARPFDGGDQDLWALHVLDNTDKHRLLLVVAAAWTALETGAPALIAARMAPAEPVFPVENGTVLFRLNGAVSRPVPEELLPRPLFDLSLMSGDRWDGEPVMVLLPRLVDRVTAVVESITGNRVPRAT